MPLSQLSCLWFAFLGKTPKVVGLRLVRVTTAKLPAPARVKRTCRAFHPIGHSGFGPNPAGGFAVLLGHRAPALDKTDLPHSSGRRVPLAHIQLAYLPWDRISGLLSGGWPEDYSEKPPSNVAGISRCTTLYGTRA